MKVIENSDVLLLNVPMDRVLRDREDTASLSAMPPLGLLYIASSLKKEGFVTSFIDISVEVFEKDKIDSILDTIHPKVIGISTYVEAWDTQKTMCNFLKHKFPDAVIAAGGHCAHFCYQELLKDTEFDFALRGEGEKSFVELCQFVVHKKGTIGQINGLVYRNDNQIIVNPDVERVKEIDQLEYPDRALLDFSLYSYPFTISTARGCPGKCIFCSSQAFWGRNVYLRKPENIIKEIEHVYHLYNLKEFFIVDDTFTLVPKRTIIFCELLAELQAKVGASFSWGCESRADVVSRELLTAMAGAGCKMIQFGMESGNNDILKSIKKAITYEQLYEAVKMAHELGIRTNVSYIIGHPEDTEETINETLDKALTLKKKFNANILCSINTPYPGTELHREHEKLGVKILIKSMNQYRVDMPIIETKYLTANDLRRLFVKANEMLY